MTAYDHWFRLDVEVTGTAKGRARLASGLEAHGWVVTVLDEDGPRRARWLVEAGVTGSRAGAASAVRLVLNKLVGQSPAEVDLRLQEPIDRQEQPRGRYFVQRPVRGPSRFRALAARSRLFDTGRELFLPPGPDIRSRAGAEAVRALPGVALPPADGVPRPVGAELDRPGRTGAPGLPSRVAVPVGSGGLIAALLIGLLIGGRPLGPAAWVLGAAGVALTGTLIGTVVVHSPHWAAGPRHSAVAACLLGIGVAAGLAAAAAVVGAASPKALPSVLVTAGVLVCGNGLRLLLRGLSWQATAAWLVPALLPILLVGLPGFGFSLHAFYLDGFGLNREDAQVPGMWQVIADAKALVVVAGPLVAVSLLGYARHLHAFDTFGGLSVAAALLFVAFAGALALYQSQIIVPASHAAATARQQAREGRQPTAYFGIAARRVCLRPVGEAGWDGAAPVAEHPYLVFPAAGDWAALWDVRTGETVNVKREQYRISDSTAPTC
ncbi:hypothetical protein [Streptomyces sp. TLI_171]|uniref:hypothetical protein n=1 Tax=Streptomyces sp. TLI_171 TaxID=1938859 RepID=UPI000C198220|nr:hypothetical protein [Streptomyces sp. TLI_171]RKE18424.1 hypothetical protein BX266_1714 [Streptomyces sp. TLI_171]